MITNETRPTIAETFSSGQKLGDSFTLKQKLSSGDTGVIWLAHDGESDKEVDLLFLPDPLASDPRVTEELRAQVKQNRQLVHPRVLRTHDFIDEPGWAAISFDHVEAETLASLMAKKDNGCFNAPEIQPWIISICQTLDDAHRSNLLHRDLAPSNFLVTKGGDLLVANFGISRIILDALSRVRGPGAMDEHLAFVSPQQLDGEHPARWDDVYSMGILVYTLLTGKPPFAGEDLFAQIRKVVPPSITDKRAELGIQGEPVPENWEKTVAACISKHALQRPKSAREVGVKLGGDIGVMRAMPVTPAAPPASSAPAVPVSKPAEPAAAKPAAPAPKAAEPISKPAAPEKQKTPAAPARESKKSTPLPPEDELGEILWRTNEPKSKPQPNPASPFAHLLEKLPDEPSREKKPFVFPAGKVVIIGAAVLVVLLLIVIPHKPKTPSGTSTATKPGQSTAPAPIAPPIMQGTPGGQIAKIGSPAPVAPQPTASPAVVTEKTKELDKARAAFETIDKNHQEKLKLRHQAETDLAAAQKALDEKQAAAVALKKATDDAVTSSKQREDAAAKAIVDAEAAKKIADEKARAADDAKKAKDEAAAKLKEQQDALQKSGAELPVLQKTLDEKLHASTDATNAEKDALAQFQLQELTVNQAKAAVEEEAAAAKAAAAAAAAARAAQTPTPALALQTPVPQVSPGAPSSSPAPSVLPMAQASASPGFASGDLTPITPEKSPVMSGSVEEAERLVLNQISKQPPAPGATPFVSTVPVTYVANPKSQIDQKMENSLGMKFAPVGDILVGVWPVRVKDFEAFSDGTNFKGVAWRQPGFKQGPDHPVVNVTWQDAVAFCKWLTEKEQKSGFLAPNQVYRLPTDLEWSKAVGLPEEKGRNPEARDMDIPDVYPWGTQWPPPPGAGNYTGEETGSDVAIKGYDDGFAWTAPVGKFNPNKYGLYDMGGNVWQWCSDWWNGEQKLKVLRGASWYNGGLKLSLLASSRWTSSPDITTDNFGFRCVVATEGRSRK